MSTMIERVARAIWSVRREEEDRCDMELEDMGDYHSVWTEARSAIAAMHEPTQEMVAKGSWASFGGGEIGSTGSKNAWRKMIDAALSEDHQ